MAHGQSSYVIGDWLINYSGGFVRRGLPGAVVLAIRHTAGVPPAWVVFATQTAVFLALLGCIYWLTQKLRWGYFMAAMLLSPATLGFTVVNPYAGLRKEVLLFASLACVICATVFGRLRDRHMSALLCAIAVGLALSHEGLAVGAPYFFAVIAIERGTWRAVKIFFAPVLLGGFALIAALLHPGNLAMAQAICSSLGSTLAPFGQGQGICSGSIAWLQISASQAHERIAPEIRRYHRVRLFSLLAVPALAPAVAQLVLLYRRDGLRREIATLAGCALISIAGTGFLFYFALDWGRWIHLQAFCLMLLIVMIDRRALSTRGGVTAAPHQRSWVRYAATLAVFLYATAWTLPGTRSGDGQRGYLDVLRMLHAQMHSPK